MKKLFLMMASVCLVSVQPVLSAELTILRDAFNEMVADGTIMRIRNKWHVE